MVLRKLSQGSDSESSDDLPWLDKYIRETGDKEAAADIHSVYACDSGLLILTDRYKAYLYENSEDYENLSEALHPYVKAARPLPVLVCTANKRKKPVICVDDERVSWRWYKMENKFVQVMGKGEYDKSPVKRVNPLLSGLGENVSSPAEGLPLGNTGVSVGGVDAKVGKQRSKP